MIYFPLSKFAKLKSAFSNFWMQMLRNRIHYVNSSPSAVESNAIEMVTGAMTPLK